MPEIDSNTRAQIQAAFAAVLVVIGVTLGIAYEGALGIGVAATLMLLGFGIFARLLITKRLSSALAAPFNRLREWAAYSTAVNTGKVIRPADESAPAPPKTEPRDPNKDYGATLTHEVIGAGRFRALLSGLDYVGDGWDRGVELTVVRPSGKAERVMGWQDLDVPRARRGVEQGSGIIAEQEGPYVIQWRNIPLPPYESEVIAEETVPLGPTGPREGWAAAHRRENGALIFTVERDSPDREPLHGFECIIKAPWDQYEASDRRKQEKFFDLPIPKDKGSFRFPEDFSDAPVLIDLRDGEYMVYWTAWEAEDESHSTQPIDVARDAFRVSRSGLIE
jgi:hypothetical protein